MEGASATGAFNAVHGQQLKVTGNGNQKKKFQGKCHACGKRGHIARLCRSKKQEVSDTVGKKSNADGSDYSAFMSGTNLARSDWLADSGASRHI